MQFSAPAFNCAAPKPHWLHFDRSLRRATTGVIVVILIYIFCRLWRWLLRDSLLEVLAHVRCAVVACVARKCVMVIDPGLNSQLVNVDDDVDSSDHQVLLVEKIN